jgi:hypothetical protein
MARLLLPTLLMALAVANPGTAADPKVDGRPLVLAHYMPWYLAKPHSKVWGWHWTMNTFDPDRVHNGKRQIASHYYPLIGPYDSGDPAVLEYHLLLLKLGGIDGVVVDWYGMTDHLDYALLHQNTTALVKAAGTYGLKFAVCYEDQTVRKLVEAKKLAVGDRVKHVRRELDWVRKNWFAEKHYARVDGKPLFLSFGAAGLTDKEWDEVFADPKDRPVYVSEHRKRPTASGAFDWPIPKEYPASLEQFEKDAGRLSPAIPVAFPRFHDIYKEGKAGESHGRIDDDRGRTWESTLTRALKSKSPVVQLATWNDWGEGTGIEPTREFGYRDLEVLQRLRGELVDKAFVPDSDDLRLPHRLYLIRRSLASKPALKAGIDEACELLVTGKVKEARAAIKSLEK